MTGSSCRGVGLGLVYLAGVLVVGAISAEAGITIEERVLANGTPVVILGDQLYLADPQGVLTRAGNGDFELRSGGILKVRRSLLMLPPGGLRGFNPQPEPPGREVLLQGARGESLALTGDRLYFVEPRGRRQCPDGTYPLAGGGRAVVRGGVLQSISSLAGARLVGASER